MEVQFVGLDELTQSMKEQYRQVRLGMRHTSKRSTRYVRSSAISCAPELASLGQALAAGLDLQGRPPHGRT